MGTKISRRCVSIRGLTVNRGLAEMTEHGLRRLSHIIANSGFGEDNLRFARIHLKFFTKMANMDLYAVAGFRKVESPHCLG